MGIFRMRENSKKLAFGASALLLAGAVTSTALSTTALAGGFSIREQSTSGLGAAFAGNAAGYDLSSIYWNPAGVATAGPGVTTESHAALLLPSAEIDPDDVQSGGAGLLNMFDKAPNDIDKVAFVPASYAAMRINDKLTIGYGFNAPFGLATEIDRENYAGQYDFIEAELKTYNFNPVVGYQITPTLALGAGLQVMYSDLNLRQTAFTGFIPNDPIAEIDANDWSFGFTLGLMWKPMAGTSIGVGYRSRMENTLEGDLYVPGAGVTPIEADLDLPEMITVSLRQDIAPNMRLLGTFEWTNWSVLQTVTVINQTTGTPFPTGNVATAGVGGTIPLSIEANWDDGYFLSGGLEYDYSDKLTVRGGVAYEWSPVQEASQRLITVPDADRVWLSVGATYKYSEATSFDFAYTHIFVEDGDIIRPSGFTGESESSVDIIGVSMKTKWGADGPLGLLKGFNN
jgi:long-chain fatty acid transport protein